MCCQEHGHFGEKHSGRQLLFCGVQFNPGANLPLGKHPKEKHFQINAVNRYLTMHFWNLTSITSILPPMHVHQDISRLPRFSNAVITIGTFDGVHHGHKLIIAQLKEEAQKINGESVMISFSPHPRRIIGKQHAEIKLINTISEKIELLEQQGIDHLVIVPFTEEFARQSAREYVDKFLVQTFRPAAIIIGHDHRFGHNREGNFQLLEALKEKYQYHLIEIPAGVLHDVTISSTQVRKSIINSRMEEANNFLGYAYFFSGTVVEGNKMGRTIGFPTANLLVSDLEKLLPGHGVYTVTVRFMTGLHKDQVFNGMMNIGVRPTVDGTRETIEVNLFDFDEEIYGERLKVSVHHYLRGEHKFTGLEGLKAQLANDKIMAMEMLRNL
jgi:riboflavin kinase / FMN adenylyltransferase